MQVEEESLPTPPAPIKPRRRRRPLLERWRSSTTSKRDTNPRPLKKSPIEDYYRVDTVSALTTPLAAASAASSSSSSTAGIGSDPDPAAAANSNDVARHHQTYNGKKVRVLLPGLPRYEDDWARDSHDFFNLIVLVPVSVLNVMNWNWDKLALVFEKQSFQAALQTLQASWTGDWFDLFFTVTATYFVLDMLWILLVPSCVKSPGIILQHHFAVLFYLMIPLHHPPVRYCMGACMAVEVNTWFLIARRVFNKQGFPPWTFKLTSWWGLRIKVISIFFYATWISIRCLLYPVLLVPFYRHWRDWSRQTGSSANILLPSVPLHAAFCLLNLKWTYELILSKLRYNRRQRRLRMAGHKYYDPSISKGL